MLSGIRTLSVAMGAAVVAALGCTLLFAGAASAAPAWLGALDLSSLTSFAQGPSVAVDPEGEAVAVWQQVDGTVLEASVHPADQSWRPPVQVASDAIGDEEVAFDAHGDATVVWLNTSLTVQSATLAAGASTWSAPVTVSPAGVSAPQLAVDPRGDAVAVWTAQVTPAPAQTFIVQAAFKPAGATTWQTPIQLSTVPNGMMPTPNNVTVPQVALDPQGDAVAVWVQTVGANPPVVWAASRPAVSGVWQTPVSIGPSGGGPQVAIDPAGRATAIWEDASGIRTADQPPGGAWSAPATVPESAGGLDPSLAIDPQGDATAAWNQPAGTGEAVADAATRPAGGAWPTPVVLSTAQSSNHPPSPQVKVDDRDDAVAVWDRFDGTNHTVMAANRRAGGSWPAPAGAKTLSSEVAELSPPQVAVDPQGNAAVVWASFDGSTQLVQAAGYDGSGPLLNGLSIPERAVVNTPVTFSVAPVDAWSPVSSTTWSFGDGHSGSGETLTHMYANPGTYTVAVTSTDGLGNPTTSNATITIAPHASPPPPSSPPSLSQVSQSHGKWREGSKEATIAAKHKPKRPPVGTTFSFTVNQAVHVTLTFTRSVAGRKVDGKCQAPTRHNREHPSCKHAVTQGTLNYPVAAGHHTIAFDGRIGHRKLPLGVYTLKLTATNSSRQHSRTATLKFTIVK